MNRYKVYADDGYVFVTTGADEIVLSFQSEFPKADIRGLTNILEQVRRDGFRQAQEMLDKSVSV